MYSMTSDIEQKNTRVIRGFDIDSVTDAPLQLTEYAYLNADHKDVFAVVSDHASLHQFTLTISRVDVDNSLVQLPDEVGVGTMRYCHTPAGLTLHESIVTWQPPVMYGYMIRNFQMILPHHLGIILTEPTEKGKTLLSWNTYFDGRLIGGTFARITLGIILPDMVKNMAKHFDGQVIPKLRVRSYLASMDDTVIPE